MPELTIKETWKKAWRSRLERRQLIAIIILIPSFTIALPFFFSYIETRSGIVMHDILLARIPAHNVSVLIFSFIWGMVLLVLYRSLYNPSILITYCLTLAVVTVARVTCITLVSLDPPAGLIPLTDPLTGVFYGNTQIVKDLFFSGHIATLTAIYFSLEWKTDKRIGLFSVCSVAILLLVQHIHYTIDVVASPIITYLCYLFARHFFKLRTASGVYRESFEEAIKV